MKINKISKFFICSCFCIIALNCAEGQKVNGRIIKKTNNLTILKVWGTHSERGFAYGYLMGDKIKTIYEAYVKPNFGKNISFAKIAIKSGKFKIENKYINEAKAVIKGMEAGGANTEDFDYSDLLIANSLLDFYGFSKKNGCSSLISWGEATQNTDLNGKSIITRHMDWEPVKELVENNVVVIHIPSEPDEQPWLMVGYAGQISVLSGTNSAGLSVFQHVMPGDYKYSKKKPKYEPIWFSLRKVLEQKDYDNSGQNDVNDLRKVLSENEKGYADGYIITAMAPNSCNNDSLTACVAELAPDKPYITYRTNSYNDKIDGKNVYAANDPIARKDEKSYCARYFKVIDTMGKGTGIDETVSWNIMKEKSKLSSNLQMMQIIPEKGILKLSVWEDNNPAYMHEPVVICIKEEFSKK